MAVAICVLALLVIAAPSANARPGHPVVSPTLPPQAAVISLSVISAQRAARTLQTLFPGDRIRVDSHANAVIVVGPPDDLQQMRTIVQGIDVKNPQQPNAEVVPLHVLRPRDVVGRLRQLYPAAHIEAASKQSLLIRATPQDLNEIKALISTKRFGTEAATHGTTDGSVRMVIQDADRVKIQYRDANGVRRDVMAHNPHASEPGTRAHTRAALKGKTVRGSHQDIHR